MIAILSPSKTLAVEKPRQSGKHTIPDYLEHSEILVDKLRKMSSGRLARLMGISAKLADENRQRYQQWATPFDPTNAIPAALMFKGDVYDGLRAETFTAKDWRFAQQQLRIVSGLYGLLRPLDLVQPYRLEMGTKLTTRRGKDLYAFWGERIASGLRDDIEASKGDPVLMNLASNEYFKVIGKKRLNVKVVAASFKEMQGNSLKMITFFAKKARGTLARYMTQNQIKTVEGLKDFREDGYCFNSRLSTDDQLLFTRGG